MAFTYKTIGSTAAAVVSLLSVGTLCWWQRSPGPLNAPRPQDEAEIMTACLERHYAMGRTGTQFTIVRPACVSQVPDTNAVGGVRYITNSAAHTLTNTIGFFPNATFNYTQSVRDAVTERAQPYSDASVDCLWILPPTNYMTGQAWNGSFASPDQILMANDTQWWTNWVTLSAKTELICSNVLMLTTNISSVVTQVYISATSTRSYGGYYLAGTYGVEAMWSIGSSYLENQDGSLEIIDESGLSRNISVYQELFYIVAAGYDQSWYAYDTYLPIRGPVVMVGNNDDITLDYAYSSIMTNYKYQTAQIVITNTTPYNAWGAGKTFSFERDSKPYWWSTNSYNDMARALSLMQWQRRKGVVEQGIKLIWDVTWSVPYASSWDSWTNRNSVLTNITVSISTNTTTLRKGGSRALISGGLWSWGSGYGDIQQTPWLIDLHGEYWLFASSFTNISPFVVDHGTVFATNLTMTTNGIGLEPAFLNQRTPLLSITNFTLAQGAGIVIPFEQTAWGTSLGTDWTNAASTLSYELESALRAFVMAEWDRMWATYGIGGTPALGSYYPYVSGITNSLELVPDFEASYQNTYGTYRVQFSALTNYLNHAPAR